MSFLLFNDLLLSYLIYKVIPFSSFVLFENWFLEGNYFLIHGIWSISFPLSFSVFGNSVVTVTPGCRDGLGRGHGLFERRVRGSGISCWVCHRTRPTGRQSWRGRSDWTCLPDEVTCFCPEKWEEYTCLWPPEYCVVLLKILFPNELSKTGTNSPSVAEQTLMSPTDSVLPWTTTPEGWKRGKCLIKKRKWISRTTGINKCTAFTCCVRTPILKQLKN